LPNERDEETLSTRLVMKWATRVASYQNTIKKKEEKSRKILSPKPHTPHALQRRKKIGRFAQETSNQKKFFFGGKNDNENRRVQHSTGRETCKKETFQNIFTLTTVYVLRLSQNKEIRQKITMKKKENENGPNLATHIQEKDEPCGNWSNKNKKIIISVELLPNRSRGCHENIHDCLSFFCGSFFSKSLSIPFINTQSQSGKKKINSLLCCTFLPVVSPQGCNPSA